MGNEKFKRLRGKIARAWEWLEAARQRQPKPFAHWHLLAFAAAHLKAGLWEPGESRGSRRVLRERKGEAPSRHPPRSTMNSFQS